MSRFTVNGVWLAVIIAGFQHFSLNLTWFETALFAVVVFVIARKILKVLWLRSAEGQTWLADCAQAEAEAAWLAHEQYVINMRAAITAEYQERVGDPYADVPQAWMLYRWNELENQAAAEARHLEAADQRARIAQSQSFQNAFNTGMVLNTLRHEGSHR